jgi:hypothetical protein
MAAAKQYNSADVLGIPPTAPRFVALSLAELKLGVVLIFVGAASMLGLSVVGRAVGATSAVLLGILQALSGALAGALFGAGLAVAGMVRPTKVGAHARA